MEPLASRGNYCLVTVIHVVLLVHAGLRVISLFADGNSELNCERQEQRKSGTHGNP
jgi:hypothetical protein